MSQQCEPAATPAKAGIFGKNRKVHLPGEVGIWIVIIGEMTFYTLFFMSFMMSRAKELDLFNRSAATLPAGIGLANMILLLLSSLAVALGVRAFRERIREQMAPMLFAVAFLCGAAFIGNKVVEYYIVLVKCHASAYANNFFNYYWILTLIHLTHLVAGMIALGIMVKIARKPVREATDAGFLESCASFWHAVDLLWIILFPLLYLMR